MARVSFPARCDVIKGPELLVTVGERSVAVEIDREIDVLWFSRDGELLPDYEKLDATEAVGTALDWGFCLLDTSPLCPEHGSSVGFCCCGRWVCLRDGVASHGCCPGDDVGVHHVTVGSLGVPPA